MDGVSPTDQAMRASVRRRFWWLMLLAAVIVVLDLWTKHLASMHLEMYRPVPLLSWFNLTLAHNYGAAFSFLGDQSGWQRWVLSGLSAGVSAFIVVWLWRLQPDEGITGLALALVLGGAIGNLVDRLRLGYVVDFIDWHAADRHWPAFNIADSAITCGVVLMLIDALILAPRRQRQA